MEKKHQLILTKVGCSFLLCWTPPLNSKTGPVYSFVLLAYASSGSFKNPFATITSLSELYVRFRRFILLLKNRKVISMNYGSSTNHWKPWRWVTLDLIFTMRDIFINSNLNSLTKFTNSSTETPILKISSNGISLKWSQGPSQSAQK